MPLPRLYYTRMKPCRSLVARPHGQKTVLYGSPASVVIVRTARARFPVKDLKDEQPFRSHEGSTMSSSCFPASSFNAKTFVLSSHFFCRLIPSTYLSYLKWRNAPCLTLPGSSGRGCQRCPTAFLLLATRCRPSRPVRTPEMMRTSASLLRSNSHSHRPAASSTQAKRPPPISIRLSAAMPST